MSETNSESGQQLSGGESRSDSASSEVIGIGTRPARPAGSVTNSSSAELFFEPDDLGPPVL